MKIGLVVDPYGEKSPGGLGRAIFEMAKGIVGADTRDSFVVYVKNAPKDSMQLPGSHWMLKALNVKSLFFGGARGLDKTLDAYVFFNPIIPLAFFPKKSIVVVHDFAYLELPERSFKEKASSLVLFCAHALSLRKATKIVAVSNEAKQSAMRHFGIDADKIEVIYNGFVGGDVSPEPIEVPVKFFLFAGVLKERKNVLGVIEAFALFQKKHAGYELLIAGKKGGSYYEACQGLVQKHGLQAAVKFLGYVTDGQLSYLYSKAEALVFPSFIEGFGMPVLEAMHKGLPVVTSNSGALAEIAGDAAVLVDPHTPADIARGLSAVAQNPETRAALIQKGSVRATEFSWEKNAQGFCKIIDSL